MVEYGYTRISTPRQDITRQIRLIKEAFPQSIILEEIHTRTEFQGRRTWEKLMHIIKPGDKIIFESVSRMCGDSETGCIIYEELYRKGVSLVFLNEEDINTDNYKHALESQIELHMSTGNVPADNLLNTIIEALNQYALELAKERIRRRFEQAEKEVKDLQKRTREGIVTARLNGKQIGHRVGTKLITKKSLAAKEIIRKRSKDFEGQLPDAEVMLLAGISHNTYYKYKKELTQLGTCVEN